MAVTICGIPASARLDLSFPISRISPYFTHEKRHVLPPRPPYAIEVGTTYGPVSISVQTGILHREETPSVSTFANLVLGQDWLGSVKRVLRDLGSIEVTASNIEEHVRGLRRVDGSVFLFESVASGRTSVMDVGQTRSSLEEVPSGVRPGIPVPVVFPKAISVNDTTQSGIIHDTTMSSTLVAVDNNETRNLNISDDGVLILDQSVYRPRLNGASGSKATVQREKAAVGALGVDMTPDGFLVLDSRSAESGSMNPGNGGSSTCSQHFSNGTERHGNKLVSCLCDQRSASYAFTPNLHHLKLSLQSHGLPIFSNDMEECRRSLLFHIFSGACVRARRTSGPKSFSGCIAVADGYSKGVEQAYNAVCILLSKDVESLCAVRESVSAALSLPLEGDFLDVLVQYRRGLAIKTPKSKEIYNSIANVYQLGDAALVALSASHGLSVRFNAKRNTVLKNIVSHLVTGQCVSSISGSLGRLPVGCAYAHAVVEEEERLENVSSVEMQASLVLMMARRLSLKDLKKLCEHLRIKVPEKPKATNRVLRNALRQYADGIRKSKNARPLQSFTYRPSPVGPARSSWPPLISSEFKDKLLSRFDELVEDLCRGEFTCCSCAGSYHVGQQVSVGHNEMDLTPLTRPDLLQSESQEEGDEDALHEADVRMRHREPWLQEGYGIPKTMLSEVRGLEDFLLEPKGVEVDVECGENHELSFCKSCYKAVQRGKTPALSLANRLYIGPVPPELTDLTVVEQNMIARCRTKAFIIRLQESDNDFSSEPLGSSSSTRARKGPPGQRAMRGHVIVYPQDPSATLNVLPPSLDELAKPIAVVFIGSNPPTKEWLEKKASFLAIRPRKVRAALLWLIENNPLYKDVKINYGVLDELPEESILPVHMEHVVSKSNGDPLTSTYDPVRLSVPQGLVIPEGHNLSLERLVIADVDVNMPEHMLHAAAVRHVKDKNGGWLQIPHRGSYINEFNNPDLFPLMYPCLFPYGLGGFGDCNRPVPLTMRRHVKHLFCLSDQRFQRHNSFLFSVFNMMQRHEMLYRTSMKVKRSRFAEHARRFIDVDPATIKRVAERYAAGDTVIAYDEKEEKVLKLMREVKLITSRVQGSSYSRVYTRNEIRAVITERGLPSFYITVNPADVLNPIVRIVAGQKLSMDDLCSMNFMTGWSNQKEIRDNPFTGARFFKFMMEAFIKAVLGYDPDGRANSEGGVLGKVTAYYGCVEAQGRGSLHCHMLVWLDGALNPDEMKDKLTDDEEFRDRVIRYLDDTIHTAVPPPLDGVPVHVLSSHMDPCTVYRERKSGTYSESGYRRKQRADLRNIVNRSQFHGEHHPTCFKYCRPGEPKVCRFGMDEGYFVRDTTFDLDSGRLTMRCLDGMINNYNPTMTEALRCNTDIKFIGSGSSAKAILYYVTNYITKTQLKAHVAFSAVESAVTRLGKVVDSPDSGDLESSAKRLLNACARAVLYHQELSAQQVASYLLDFGDKFVSDKFRTLYWPSFERYIETAESSNSGAHSSNRAGEDVVADVDDGTGEDVIVDNDDNVDEDEYDDVDVPLEPDDEEVRIMPGRNDDGSLKAEPGQLSDYIHRPSLLRKVSVWDYVAQVDKIGVKGRNRDRSEREEVDNDQDRDSESEYDYATALHVDFADNGLLGSVERERPKGFFREPHMQCGTHKAVVRKPTDRFIPMAIGPAIPRRDRGDSKDRHARLMLILFKPWRVLSDLKPESMSWQDAYQRWLRRADSRVKRIIDNMQLLHECKDSRDAHLESRKRAWGNSAKAIEALQSRGLDVVLDEGCTGEVDENELAVHLERAERLWTDKKKLEDREILEVQYYGERAGMFSAEDDRVLEDADTSDSSERVVSDDMAKIWEADYDARKKSWHQSWASEAPEQRESVISQSEPTRSESLAAPTEPPLFVIPDNDGSVDQEAFEQINGLIAKHSLNVEQARAFRIVAQHSLDTQSEQLRMFIGGPGGTGKSTVIKALVEFFGMRGQGRRLRLSSFTGVAARNIGGVTLHAALTMRKTNARGGTSTASREQLSKIWRGVNYLVVDEVSMIGCKMMGDISDVLCRATGVNKPFGGVNVIFAGDFAQLPPVGEWRLYRDVPREADSVKDQANAFGRLLWLSVDTVVMLHQVMRTKDVRLTELLGRLRYGNCTDADHALLSGRLACNLPSWSYGLGDTPIIVSQNSVKDQLNVRAAKAFAAATGRSLHWYHSTDCLNGAPIQQKENQDKLEKKCSSETAQLLAKIPMVIGMPVMFTSNFDVRSGVVNGAVGRLTRIRYTVDDRGRRHATSCVVKLDQPVRNEDVRPLHHLRWDEVVATEKTYSFKSKDRFPNSEIDGLSRTQLPIQPAFAITCHKSQGKTMEKVVVDLKSCKGTESPYVMISRATSLEGLVLLRPFHRKKIQCRPSEERRKEFRRMDVLRLKTLTKYGNEEECERAFDELAKYSAEHIGQVYVRSNEFPSELWKDKTRGRFLLNVVQDATTSLQRHIDMGTPSPDGNRGEMRGSKRKASGNGRVNAKKPRVEREAVKAASSRGKRRV